MQKKLIILSALVFLASCTSTKDIPTDFTSLYKANVSGNIKEVRTLGEKLGYLGNYEVSGTLRAMADVPTLFSGSLDSGYEGLIHSYGVSQDSSITLKDPRMSYEMLLASGSVTATEVSMITRGSDSYIRYAGLSSIGMYDDTVRGILAKYEKSWLAITETDLLSTLSGSSESDKLAFQMSQAISRMKLEDIEKYLTKYPLWKETKSLGMVDGLATYEVELAKENIIAMVDAFAEDSTGKKLDENARAGLQADLDSRNITGTIGYDPTNPKRAKFQYRLPSTTGEVGTLTIDTSDTVWRIVSGASSGALDLTLTRGDSAYTLKGKIGDDMTAITIDATVRYDGEKFASLDATISASEQGMTIRVHHESAKNGAFLGSIDAGVGTLSWTGSIKDVSLKGLHIRGAMIGSSLTLDLAESTGSLLRGPLLMKNGDDTIVQADVGLRVDKEHFDLVLDIPSPESPIVRTHAEISLTGKKEKTTKSIEAPKDTTSFSGIATEISEAMPVGDLWSEQLPSDLTGTSLPLSSDF